MWSVGWPDVGVSGLLWATLVTTLGSIVAGDGQLNGPCVGNNLHTHAPLGNDRYNVSQRVIVAR